MRVEVVPAPLDVVQPFRDQHRAETRCQFVLDSWPARRWADTYVLRLDGGPVGYGAVGGVRADPKDTVTEFFVLPAHRGAALDLFRALVAASGATKVEAQTNDRLLTLMLLDCATHVARNEVLFDDGLTTHLPAGGATFRPAVEADREQIVAQGLDADAGWLLEVGGAVAATGGVLFHYNPPYGDLYMAVAEAFRRRGYGSYLVQELKRACYGLGKVPAARCNPTNAASRATLQRAGMFPCARLQVGTLGG